MGEHSMPAPGTLYVVATPIGNMDDITLRALKILQAVDRIAAEDTRRTGRLLTHHGIQTRLVSYHEHNERQRTGELLACLARGESIALVSDAGTPAISDPGYVLVHEAVQNGILVSPIPGPSAVITALSAAGLPTDAFLFLGFPPRKTGRRQRELQSLAAESRTLVWYESPHRIARFVEEVQRVFGERYAVIGREITKRYEEFLRGSLSELARQLGCRGDIKGEITLLVSGCDGADAKSTSAIHDAIGRGLQEGRKGHSALAREIAAAYGISRREAYDMILARREEQLRPAGDGEEACDPSHLK
jgi:16S rRNA (cytidine1402-2'-O)-methyltransferase